MDPIIGGSLISAGSSLLGGLFGSSSARKAEKAAAARFAEEMKFAREQADFQREAATMGLRWRVDDAKAAGIHPLFALGASLSQPSPVSLMTSAGLPSGSSPMAGALSEMGQDLSRAFQATRTPEEKIDAQAQALEALALRRAELENNLLETQIWKLKQPQVGPSAPSLAPRPIDGQGDVPPQFGNRVEVKPLELPPTDPGNPSKEVYKVPDFTYAQTPTGLAPVPSADVKERIEDNLIPEHMWSWRNNILPNFGSKSTRPDPELYDPGHGNIWVWNPWAQEWQAEPLAGYTHHFDFNKWEFRRERRDSVPQDKPWFSIKRR